MPTQVGHCHKIGPFPSTSAVRKETYACVYVDGLGLKPKDAPELLANARLIAASPALYEAGRKVLDGLNARIKAAGDAGGQSVPVFDGIAELHDALALVEANDE